MKIWKEKKNHLCKLIKKLSDKEGGDDREWLKEYAIDLIKKYTDNLEEPILACEKLLEQYIKVIYKDDRDEGYRVKV